MDRSYVRLIRIYIRNLDNLKAELKEIEDEIISLGGTPDGQPRGNAISDTTFNGVEKLMSNPRRDYLKRVIDSIEETLDKIKGNTEILAIWNRTIVKEENAEVVAYDLGLSRSSLFRRKNKIYSTIAEKIGFVSNDKENKNSY